MRYKQIAILLAAAVSINTAAPVAAEAADSVAAEAQTQEPVSETMPPEEEADEQTGQQEALYEETLEDTPISEETVAESHSSFSMAYSIVLKNCLGKNISVDISLNPLPTVPYHLKPFPFLLAC